MKTREELEAIAKVTVDAIFTVHKALGPGLLESAYQACLEHELRKRGITVRCGIEQPIPYDDVMIDPGYRMDTLIEESIIVENKSVQALAPIFEAQLLTYLKLSRLKIGFLVNWNVILIKDGIKRMVNNL
jgi:GxxExxY protein